MLLSSVKKWFFVEMDDWNLKWVKYVEIGVGDDGVSVSVGVGGELDLFKGVEKFYLVGVIVILGRGRCLMVLFVVSGDLGGVDILVYGLFVKNVSVFRLRF